MAGSEPNTIEVHEPHGHNAGLIEPSVVKTADSDTTSTNGNCGNPSDESEALKEEPDDSIHPKWRRQLRSPGLSLMGTNALDGIPEDNRRRISIDKIRREESQSLIELLENVHTDAEFNTQLEKKFSEGQDQWEALINICSERSRESPLHIAIRNGLWETTGRLIYAGASLNAEDEEKREPLHYACIYSPTEDATMVLHLATLIKLEERKVGPDSDGRNPLHHALHRQLRDKEAIEMLCEITDIQAKDKLFEWTPLHVAAHSGNNATVELLLMKGVDTSIQDCDGWTPLITSTFYGEFEVSCSLLRHMKSDSNPARQRAIHVQDHQRGLTALMRVCAATLDGEDNSKAVRLAYELLKSGGNLGISDKEGRTAIHHAMATAIDSNGDNSDIAFLATHLMPEEDLLRLDKNRETAFDHAFSHKDDGSIQAILKRAISRLLEKKPLHHNLFRWLARRAERHELALYYLGKMPTDEAFEAPPPSQNCTLAEWAIRHQLPGILLSLSEIPHDEISQDTLNRNIREGKDLIEKLKQPSETKRPLSNQAGMEKNKSTGGGERDSPSAKDERYQSNLWNTMGDLLDHLDTKTIKRPKETRTISSRTDAQKEISSQFYAAIVEMLPDDEDSSYSYKFRKIDEVIYGNEDSRINTIREAVQEVQQLEYTPKENAKKSEQAAASNERNFVWVHLPSNNLAWMMDAMRKITRQIGCTSDEFERLAGFLRSSRVEIPDKTSPSRFMRPRYVKSEKKGTKSDGLEGSAVYMPFLSLSLHPQEDRKGKSKTPQPAGMREKLFAAYEGSIHGSPTLDEYYHHFATDSESQTDRKIRNDDQIVTKHLRNQSGSEEKTCELLRVSQLWVWTIGSKWMVTSTSCAYSDEQSEFVLGFLKYLHQRPEGGTQGRGPASPAELSAAIVDYCVESYERNERSLLQDGMANRRPETGKISVDRSIRQVFSDFINDIGRKEAKLFKDFRDRIRNERPVNKESLTQSRTRVEGTVKRWRDAAMEAAELLVNIKDVRDELNILRTVAELQKKVQNSMSSIKGSSDNSRGGPAAAAVLKDITELDSVAGRVYEAVNATINLHESEIANLQSEIAIIQTTETMSQGKTVMIFTAVTSIFLPLSFLTSLFALDVASFLEAPWWSLIVIFVVPLPFLAVGVDYVRGSQGTKCCLKALGYFIAFIRGTANLFKLVCFLLIFSRRTKKQAKKTWEPPTAD